MALQKVSELKEPPIVREVYLVTCVLWNYEWLPVIGSHHHDKEIGIYFEHYHKDLRFLPSWDFSYGKPKAFEFGRSLPPARIELKKLLCLREMPRFDRRHFPHPQAREQFRKLDTIYAGRSVLCGKCPHKGMPLESIPKDKSGHVICNGHGLKIDMNKGVVVKRSTPSAKA